MSGLGHDAVPKIKISTTLFVAGERQCVLDRFRFRPVCCGFRVYCSNKPTRLGVRRRMPSRRIAGSSRGEERRRTTRRRDGRSSGPWRFGAFFFRPRTSKKKGSKSWSTPVCDCLEKETKTVILSDNSNEPELRARSDEATTTRCRKPKLRNEKLLRLRQRCTCSAAGRGRSITMHIWHSQPFHGVTCVLLMRAWFRTGKSARSGRACLPSIGKEGADCRSKGIFLPMGDHGILGSLRRAFSPP